MKRHLTALFLLPCLWSTNPCLASEEQANRFEWQVELGVASYYTNSLLKGMESTYSYPVGPLLNVHLKYWRLFLEPQSYLRSKLSQSHIAGFKVYENSDQQLALVVDHHHLGFGPNDPYWRIDAHDGLNTRKDDASLGLRYQHQGANTLWSFQINQGIRAHSGTIAQLFYGYRQELRNWDLFFNIEASYFTAEVVNYYYGVSDQESRPGRPSYKASAGQRLHLGMIGAYPLTQRWYTELGTGVNFYSRAFNDSPLTRQRPEFINFATLRYVF